jgi:response regulator NasT
MGQNLRVAVAAADPRVRAFFERLLPRLGHRLVVAAESGPHLAELCRGARPDLVVVDQELPALGGLWAAGEVQGAWPAPVVLLAGDVDAATVAGAPDAGVLAFLLKPLREAAVAPALALACRHFETWQALLREAADLRQALEDRKLFERAKGAVARRLAVDEEEVFRRLLRYASERGLMLAAVARLVISSEEVFHDLEGC